MKINIHRDGIHIFPENGQDVAFLTDTLGLEDPGDAPKVFTEFNNGIIESISIVRKKEDKATE